VENRIQEIEGELEEMKRNTRESEEKSMLAKFTDMMCGVPQKTLSSSSSRPSSKTISSTTTTNSNSSSPSPSSSSSRRKKVASNEYNPQNYDHYNPSNLENGNSSYGEEGNHGENGKSRGARSISNVESATSVTKLPKPFLVTPKKAATNSKSTPTKKGSTPLKGIDPKIQETILNEIMDHSAPISFDDIAGLSLAKRTLMETVILPNKRPDLFSGLRSPPKGLLLFGPPGNGKTMVAKAIAKESEATFFAISASSLTSKWLGDSEKLVRALFAIAREKQPSIIFIDEIDSVLSERSSGEHESSRRLKTEFLVQFDGVTTSSEDRILVMGATNRPQELDEAARRRLVKRIYVPLPEKETRQLLIRNLLKDMSPKLTSKNMDELAVMTEGYSASDITALCKEAALGPIRNLDQSKLHKVKVNEVRPITMGDFHNALTQIRPSVSKESLREYIEWNNKFGSMAP